MHDLDENGKIDGLELIKGITHLHDEANGQFNFFTPLRIGKHNMKTVLNLQS